MALAPLFSTLRVVVRGGGDLGSGAVYRLHKAGFAVIVTELAAPLCVRRAVCYGMAALEGALTVDGITARRAAVTEVDAVLAAGEVPVIVDPVDEVIAALHPAVIVDARMLKYNPGTTRDDAPLVVALGPGYTAGADCHAVVETMRGHYLGRVYWEGPAAPDTGVPGSIGGATVKRALYAPTEGFVQPLQAIGDVVEEGTPLATMNGLTIISPFHGVLRGLIHPEVPVAKGVKIGDVDPRAARDHCFAISDKSLSVGGGVVEAVLSAPMLHTLLATQGGLP
jgi:xanthine dehydrogenase accessory factor